ncbi:MAG: hypothetical protein CMH54_09345 [Myxococcales bacterium]|nr:hypothetical protein [Myxococcales bacterium]|tara:strand:+ start:476 stop:1255 length:780 start_codon:yes stop_codon:yes gene_type:complete
MVMLDLRRDAAEENIQLSDMDTLTEFDRLSAIKTWKGRMVNEHISARVFAALVPQMMKSGLPSRWQEEIAGMIQQELRHGRQCAAMVHALGGEAVAELPELSQVPEHPDCSPLEGLLRNIISISCLSETVAVSLIGAEHEDVGPPEMRETLGQILAEEVQHARFGWMVMRETSDRIPPDMKERLGDYLVGAFKHLRDHELAALPNDHTPSDEASKVGVCDGNDARALFFDTVEQVIIPGLEEHGLPAGDAWKASYKLPS